MKNQDALRTRYLGDGLSIRLGGLAANLLRIKSFAGKEANQAVVASLIEESKFFIEWTAAEVELTKAAELVELQIQLSRWQCNWDKIWFDPELRTQMAEQARVWSERILTLSGLLSD